MLWYIFICCDFLMNIQVLPFRCLNYPTTSVCNTRRKDCYSIIAMYDFNYFVFDVLVHYITWDVARIIWIGFHKNGNNDSCLIDLLPKDVLKHALNFLGMHASIGASSLYQ